MERCIANGNCIALGNASACGGSNGHFAFDGDSGRGFFFPILRVVVLINAAAADGRAAGKPIIRSCAALCGDVGGTGFGALDGDFISSFLSGSVNVRFGFCAAADTGTFLAALCFIDYCVAIRCVAINDHSALADRAAADACAAVAAHCILDLCVAFDGHIAIALITAADACAKVAALCTLNRYFFAIRCVAINVHSAIAVRAAANAGTTIATFCIFDFGVAFNGNLADS